MKNKETAMKTGNLEGVKLPEDFVRKMRKLLGTEAEGFFESYGKERKYGLRINPLKRGDGRPGFLEDLEKIPWTEEGYFYGEDLRPGKEPYHDAGLYYIQEPSAMSAAEILNPAPGERILDLCAAPGGKTTQTAGKMGQKGLLVSNEIHPARAKILSQNVERMGIANGVVTNMDPEDLVLAFPEFFDGILVDAPCSGEGMFRKDETAVREWSLEQVTLCAKRQAQILDCAAAMVRPGGRLVYSTCTFSPEENEQTIWDFLRRHREFSIERPDCADYFSPGRPEWVAAEESGEANSLPERLSLKDTIRIWPHKTAGEGHFAALLIKSPEGAERTDSAAGALEERSGRGKEKRQEKGLGQKKGKSREKGWEACRKKGWDKNRDKSGKELSAISELTAFCEENLLNPDRLFDGRKLLLFGENLYLVSEQMPNLEGIRVLRPGLHVGTLKKGRLEPAHGLALFLGAGETVLQAEIGDGAAAASYLRGETILAEGAEITAGKDRGWTLVTVGGYSVGWAKLSGGILKNHYPKGLRRPY